MNFNSLNMSVANISNPMINVVDGMPSSPTHGILKKSDGHNKGISKTLSFQDLSPEQTALSATDNGIRENRSKYSHLISDASTQAQHHSVETIAKQRLVRALYILGQSVHFNNLKLPTSVVSDVLNKTAVKKKGKKKNLLPGEGMDVNLVENSEGKVNGFDPSEVKKKLYPPVLPPPSERLQQSHSEHSIQRPHKSGATSEEGSLTNESLAKSLNSTSVYNYDEIKAGAPPPFRYWNSEDTKEIRQPLGLTNGIGMVPTYVGYNEHGAKQFRQPVAHRVDNVWCRSDVGEWKGLTSKGRRMRSFEFSEQLKATGIAREQERRMVQEDLKEAISKHVTECSVPYIKGNEFGYVY